MNFKAKKIKENNKVLMQVSSTARQMVEKTKQISFPVLPKTILRYVATMLGILFVLYIAIQGYSFIRNLNFDFSLPNIINNLFGQELKKDSFGRTNVLLMAVGGGQHDGPDLTDSIMIASLDHEKKTLTMISIPRDLYVKVTPGYYERINTVYDYYNRKFGKEESIVQMQELIRRLTGLEMQYYAKINFEGFKEVVDILGGIDIDVPETLVDLDYPIEDSNGVFVRNEKFVVEKGPQHMDGNTALKYARSRHSTSDFDRSKRQHMVIAAIRDKALKENYLSNPTALKRLYYAVISNLETDVSINEAIRSAFIAKDLDKNRIVSAGLNDDLTKMGGFLYTPDRALTNGAAVLLPDGSSVSNMEYYVDIRRFVDIVTSNQEIFLEHAPIRISNGTKVSGLGKSLKDKLSRFGFTVAEIGNTANKTLYDKTKILVSNQFKYQATIDNLKGFLGAGVVVENMDPSLTATNSNSPAVEIEVIIGKDYDKYLP